MSSFGLTIRMRSYTRFHNHHLLVFSINNTLKNKQFRYSHQLDSNANPPQHLMTDSGKTESAEENHFSSAPLMVLY